MFCVSIIGDYDCWQQLFNLYCFLRQGLVDYEGDSDEEEEGGGGGSSSGGSSSGAGEERDAKRPRLA